MVKVEGKSDKKKEVPGPETPEFMHFIVIGSIVLILVIVFGVIAMQLMRNRIRHVLGGGMLMTVKAENVEWRQYADAETGSPYWVNAVSGESTGEPI